MKHVVNPLSNYLFVLTLCLAALPIKAQPAPFIGANTILLSTFLADKPAYSAITTVLTEQSLAFSGPENRLLIRSQSNSVFAAKGLVFEGQIKIMAGIIELTGRTIESTTGANLPLSSRSTPVLFAKDRNSGQRLAFSYMDGLAKQLQSALRSTLTYKYQAPSI
ncbi:hypothetical protein IC229_16705 [Spirosoma sp. BT702]|uniref:Uncharacterized protein n=1 Tax=Spirosoma profusum TaxID=2771354 RepID=A0A927ARI5_9BACT|nr:hypothetical protein [Spirosoma profusum]MBD2702296.1 hypothetical protein [Spirosoma profusum]